MDAVDMAEGHDRSLLGKSVRVVVILLACIGGGIAGFAVTLAILVIRARSGHYIFALHDLIALRLDTLPIAIFMTAGLIMGILHPRGVDRAIGWGLLAMLCGSLVGAVVGQSMWGGSEGTWSGAIILGAAGLVTGAIASFRHRKRPHPRIYAGAIGTGAIISLALLGTMGATHLIESTPAEFMPFHGAALPDPSDVDAVVFLVGDAGATERDRSPLLHALARDVEEWSRALARDSAVSVVFLGDNVYPEGVRDRDHPSFPTDSVRLWNQIGLVNGSASRAHHTLGLFLPGNHDWGNRAGEEAFERIVNLDQQLAQARSARIDVALVPDAGQPGPAVRDLRRNVRLLFIDTHWFLQARSAQQKSDFFERLSSELDHAGDRTVLLLSHHPFLSAGPHGAILPGNHVGGVSYLLKNAGALVQDLNSPVYAELLQRMRAVFEATRHPPLAFVGGHDHSLQVLTGENDDDPRFALVSGAASKVSSIESAPGMLWGAQRPGWMMLVFRKDDSVDLFAIAGDQDRLTCPGEDVALAACMDAGLNAFRVEFSITLLEKADDATTSDHAPKSGTAWWTEEDEVSLRDLPDDQDETMIPPPIAVPIHVLAAARDSVTTTPGKSYSAGPIRRTVSGKLNRHLWDLPVRLPILRLDSVGGGLTPLEIIGGMQTVGLRFRGADGLDYEFRSVVKDARRTLPRFMQHGILKDVVNDQMAAQFPFAAVAVAELLQAAGIRAALPRAVVMANDPRLGDYRPLFAGRVGLFSPRADERSDGTAGFAGYSRIIDEDELSNLLDRDPDLSFDAHHYLRARLVDVLIGDWDRHAGQWSWAALETDSSTLLRAIPEDRDWAFARIDGFIPAAIRLFMPRYVGFDSTFPDAYSLMEASLDLDRRILTQLRSDDFLAAAHALQSAITDSVIRSAISRLPQPYFAAAGQPLLSALQARRNHLDSFALEFHDQLVSELHVFGTHAVADRVTFESTPEGTRIRLESNGRLRFDRVVGPETRSVTLRIDVDEDVVTGTEDLPFALSFEASPIL